MDVAQKVAAEHAAPVLRRLKLSTEALQLGNVAPPLKEPQRLPLVQQALDLPPGTQASSEWPVASREAGHWADRERIEGTSRREVPWTSWLFPHRA